VVLVRDWILDCGAGLPSMLRYRAHADQNSVYNTPPVFAIYVSWLVARWIARDVGGLERMKAINDAKASCLYGFLEARPERFELHSHAGSRSPSNVVFRLRDRALEAPLVRAAERAGFLGIGGHRSLGGLRVSLYNAVTLEAVRALCEFLEDFGHARAH
jgi:phosphoserine aminotransferase